jgi:hypothetical protein
MMIVVLTLAGLRTIIVQNTTGHRAKNVLDFVSEWLWLECLARYNVAIRSEHV